MKTRLEIIFICIAAAVMPAATPPNIVFIISDDHAWTDYGFMGHAQIETPHLDKLAARSALFTRGYVPTALCRPSLATLINGFYAHQHKVTGNDPALLPSMLASNTAKAAADPTGKAAAAAGRREPPEYAALREKLIRKIGRAHV